MDITLLFKHFSFPGQQPLSRYVVILDQIDQPFRFDPDDVIPDLVEVPKIYTVPADKGPSSPDHFLFGKGFECREEPVGHLFGFRRKGEGISYFRQHLFYLLYYYPPP